ncbi:MAG: universal stress protein [Desulfobacteraceae bacterium]|nr:MAG: universal stress protein [Desulfobacteraceae bacterium]
MFEKILFATTASPACEHAANVAFDLAKKYGSTLYVLHVLGTPTRGFSPFVVSTRTGATEVLDQHYLGSIREEMKATYSKQIEGGGKVLLEVAAGLPHVEILRFARKENVDLIVMGAHTRLEETGASRFRSIVGSTLQKVAKSSRSPLLVISRPCATCWWYFSNIIFGTDFSKASLSAFLFAYKVAKEIGCKLYLFHALNVGDGRDGKSLSQGQIEKLVQETRKRMEEVYVSKMKDFDNYEIDVWEGTPHVEILKFARERQGDLIVMAHHAREIDPEDAELGSTVEEVVLRAACPVASVNHPDKVG